MANSKGKMANFKNSMKRVADWFRNHPIVSHLLMILLVFVCVVIVSYVVMALGTRHDARRTVPDFVGLSMDDARHFASRRDLEIVINDSLYVAAYPGGVVLEQLPTEGTVVKPGRKIYVTVNSLHQRKAPVPYVAGRSLRQAKNLLETAGFTIDHLEYVEDIATNYVLAQFVNGDEVQEESTLQANLGSGIVLQVGVASNARAIAMPKIMGMTLIEARNRLWESGLNIGELAFDMGMPALDRGNAKVYQQSILPNEELKHGDRVSLMLTLEDEKVANAIAEYELALEEAARAKMEADSIANAEKRLLDSIVNANRAKLEREMSLQSQPQPATEDNFFF